MKIISVASLDGVPQQGAGELYAAMKRCTNGQRLVVCLYLMSDLPDSRHHLSDIERELIHLFPPSLGQGYSPQDYADFQASAVRGLFNRETGDVARRMLSDDDRLWTTPRRGHWRNTDLGNRTARQILRERGLLIQKDGTVLNPSDERLPEVTRRYMEEELAQAAVEQPDEHEGEERDLEAEQENLLAHVDRILSALPEIDCSLIPQASGPTFRVGGTPQEVSRVLRELSDSLTARDIVVSIEVGRTGWRVSVEANRPGPERAKPVAADVTMNVKPPSM
jgi:hypothetical protein